MMSFSMMIIAALVPADPNFFVRQLQHVEQSDLDVLSREDRDSVVFKPNFDIQTN